MVSTPNCSNSVKLSPEEQRSLRNVLQQKQKLQAELAVLDVSYWIKNCTKTKDEQDPENPYKPFPDRRYIDPVIEYLNWAKAPNLAKSRTMMASWLVAAYVAHWGFNKPATGVVFQSQFQDKALTDLGYVKELWKNSIPPLKERWPLAKRFDLQKLDTFELANGSWFAAIPGDPAQINSKHPTIVVLEEAQLIDQYEESLSNAAATRCLKIISIGTARPSTYFDRFDRCAPADWDEIRQF